ncbi:MAG TPA: hypothetical protein VIV58_02405 [Kofleriaceae bacterium]
MKMKTLRRLRTIAPRRLQHLDPTIEPDPGPAPEKIFDRSTGPFDRHRAVAMPGAHPYGDEET